jgi:hypothetical protein
LHHIDVAPFPATFNRTLIPAVLGKVRGKLIVFKVLR